MYQAVEGEYTSLCLKDSFRNLISCGLSQLKHHYATICDYKIVYFSEKWLSQSPCVCVISHILAFGIVFQYPTQFSEQLVTEPLSPFSQYSIQAFHDICVLSTHLLLQLLLVPIGLYCPRGDFDHRKEYYNYVYFINMQCLKL